MASFSSMEAAEQRYKAQMVAKKWVVGHSARDKDGVIVCRVQRYMSQPLDGSTEKGGWVTTTDDSVN